MTTVTLALTFINTVGIGVLLYKAFGVTVPQRQTAPADEAITLDSDTEGLA